MKAAAAARHSAYKAAKAAGKPTARTAAASESSQEKCS